MKDLLTGSSEVLRAPYLAGSLDAKGSSSCGSQEFMDVLFVSFEGEGRHIYGKFQIISTFSLAETKHG